MTTRQQIARGAFWTTLEFAGGEAASFAVFIVLARLVAPDDFGLIAIAGVIISFVLMFLTQGFAEAIIQKQDLQPEHLDAAFWANLVTAGVFALIVLLLADVIAALVSAPALAPVLRAMTPIILCAGISGFFHGIFKRRLEFKSLTLRALVGVVGGGIVGVVLAMLGWGVWALVAQQLTNNLLSVVILWWRSGWTPRLRVSRQHLVEMVSFGWTVVASALIGFVQKRSDILLLGLYRPPAEVGYYFLSLRLLLTTGLITYSTMQAVSLPVLSRLQGSPERFRESVAFTLTFAGAICVPLLGGLGLVAGPAIIGCFGEKWAPAIPALRILGVYGAIQALSYLTGPILIAWGRPRAFLNLAALQAVVFVAAFFLAAPHGMVAVAYASVGAQLIVLPFHLLTLRDYIGLRLWIPIRGQLAPWLAGGVMTIAVLGVEAALPLGMSALAKLALLVGAGAIAYSSTLWLAAPSLVRRVFAIGVGTASESTLARETLPSARDAA
jgi:O-antigen/teichoic acid export membrane protein